MNFRGFSTPESAETRDCASHTSPAPSENICDRSPLLSRSVVVRIKILPQNFPFFQVLELSPRRLRQMRPKWAVLKIAVCTCVRPVGWRPNPAGHDQRTVFFSYLYIMISPKKIFSKIQKVFFFLGLQRFSHSGLGDARTVCFLGT